jgi:sec-independent protein translocase protein TatA
MPFKEKLNMFGTLGIWEILLIGLVIAVLFGGKKLPQLGKGLGEGIMNFKNSLKKDPEESTEGNSKSENEKDN